MKKIFLLLILVFSSSLFAQEWDDDDFFFDDDDGIIEIDTSTVDARASEISHGALFETGSIKIGGSFTTTLGTTTVLYADDDENFWDHIKNTTLTPTLSAYLTLDARPTQTLRMYTKFGLAYPFTSSIGVDSNFNFSVSNWLSMKELFTDFSIADRAFFRFGLHTVTWGTGYFFSPVSDIINTSSIDPENTSAQVSGSVNLRTQITFPGTQNCIWAYIIPSTNFNNSYTTESYIKDTALAAKGDLVFGGWELGIGAFWKYENAPKATFTATGSIINGKVNLFGEAVYQYGAAAEWSEDTSWKDKTSIVQATIGAYYIWKKPEITIAAQYYYDGNNKDQAHQYFTHGHNIAAVVNFANIFDVPNITGTVFTMMNIGKEKLTEAQENQLASYGLSSTYLSSVTLSGMITYSPINDFSLTGGPYITWKDFDSKPTVSLKLTASLGGGKF